MAYLTIPSILQVQIQYIALSAEAKGACSGHAGNELYLLVPDLDHLLIDLV
jgi:hypothetical protein